MIRQLQRHVLDYARKGCMGMISLKPFHLLRNCFSPVLKSRSPTAGLKMSNSDTGRSWAGVSFSMYYVIAGNRLHWTAPQAVQIAISFSVGPHP